MYRIVAASQRKAFHIVALFLFLIVAVAFSDSKNAIRMELQHSVFDEFNRRHPRKLKDEANRVVIVDIDEKSLELIGQWHWPRNILANLTNSLSEKRAKAIAFDGVFAKEDRTSPHILYKDFTPEQVDILPKEMKAGDGNGLGLANYDALFAKAIRDSKVFITAFAYGRLDRDCSEPLNKNRIFARSDVKEAFLKNASYFEAAAVNLPVYSKAAAGNGSFMALPDKDGVLRRAGMLFTNNEEIYPSLSLEVVRIAELGRKGTLRLGKTPELERHLVDTNYRIIAKDKVIPVEQDALLYTYYRYFCNEDDVARNPHICPFADYISAYKFLLPEYEDEARKAVEGKIVLIGSSAEGLKDLRSTALQPFRSGAEVHANVIEQIQEGQYLLRPSITIGVEALYSLVAGLFFILIAPFCGMLVSIILCIIIISLAVFGAYYTYVTYGLLIDPVYSSLTVLGIFIISTILSYIRAEARRKQIRGAFEMYVAGDVMADLEKHPEKLKLGGENRYLTVMFTDIRNFTSISEALSPERLVCLMNEFLTCMSEIVMTHEGTLDKYIGDAMMCFWNAPRDVRRHEEKACRAALKMSDALAPVNDEIKQKAFEQKIEPIFLKAGIAMNAGDCAVGNMGSRQRFAYSALGDTVNIAARLEGQTKTYGVDIIISQSIYDKIPDFAAIELDRVRVVGKEEAVTIYALLGDEELANKDHFKNWKNAHTKMLDLYRCREFTKAAEQARACSALCGPAYDRLYDLYESRIKDLLERKAMLPEEWDGIIDAKEK